MNGDKQEFYAESVQEAVGKAADRLNVPQEELQYEVLDEGSSGFLGIGARDARIAVTVPDSPSVFPPTIGTEPPTPSQEDPTHSEEPDFAPITEPTVDSTVLEGTSLEESATTPSEEAPADLIVAIDGLATELLDKMGFDATVDAYDAGEMIKVDIGTGETGLLIGHKGETIDAVQYLLNVVIYKDRAFFKRITVDTEGYRQRRVEALQGMAHRTARRAQRERRPIELPPMSAAERRVVHVYLKENQNVSTASEGGEEDRRVVITPNS